jgi:hypothetical protein
LHHYEVKAFEAFRGRPHILLDEMPENIPPSTLATMVLKKKLRVVAVDAGKKRRLAWRLVH